MDLEEALGSEVVDLGEAWEAGLEEVWEVDLEDVVAVAEDSVGAECSCDFGKSRTIVNAYISGNNAILYLYRFLLSLETILSSGFLSDIRFLSTIRCDIACTLM